MKYKILKLLKDPNTGEIGFEAYGHEVKRNNNLLFNLSNDEIEDEDDIKTGFIINNTTRNSFPITEYILSLLSFEDLEPELYLELLTKSLTYAPEQSKAVLNSNIDKLNNLPETQTGIWNREEMEYYDRAVNSEEKRKIMLKSIRSKPLWHIHLVRKKFLTDKITKSCSGTYILEVGSGNSRSISWLLPPDKYNYNYIGSDISIERLKLAKMVIPEGDFIQCSGVNLPFLQESFYSVIVFGAIHHLPNHFKGINNCLQVIKKKGYFLFHEPIMKPKLIAEGGQLAKLLTNYEHSEHDNELNWKETLETLDKENVKLESVAFNGSLLKTILAFWVSKVPALRKQKFVWQIIYFLDWVFLKVLCWRPNALGPKTVLSVIKKP